MNKQDKFVDGQERLCPMCRENVQVIFKRKEGRCWLNKKGDEDCSYFREVEQQGFICDLPRNP